VIEPPDAIGPSDATSARPQAASAAPRVLAAFAAALSAVAVGLSAFAVASDVLPLGFGPLGFVIVFEEQLLLAVVILLVPISLATRARHLLVGLAVSGLVFGGLFGSEWVSLPGSAAGRSDLGVMSWNLEYGTRTPSEAVGQLQGVDADLIGLVELEPPISAAIEADPTLAARYPYRFMVPRDLAWGVGLMSRYPISDMVTVYPPACLEALVTTPRGPVRVIVGHPRHASVHGLFRVPIVYDPRPRDVRIETIREMIDASLASGDRLLVVGDFNTTTSEPEYRVLTKGLRDTHTEVGEGPGWTWRPDELTFLPFGLIRIDLQLSGGAIRPSSTRVDCSRPGDHCQLFGTYEID
jgi:endonuclease/exonuclease/phosphatase (EEP) superfamily protein YafD